MSKKKNALGFLETIYILLAAVLIAIVFNYFSKKGVKVSQADFGEAWPLTVSEGKVDCLKGQKVIFEAPSGTIYALNGTAQIDYPGIEPIWKINEELKHELIMAGTPEDTFFPRVSITPLRQKGQSLCK